MERRTLTLKKRVDPATRPQVDPAKVSLSELLGFRFIDRGGRYIAQKLVVVYDRESVYDMGYEYFRNVAELSRTWVDVPLVPEAYCG